MEIGSEFWEKCFPDTFINSKKKNTACLLSGRTALDYIIQDIKANRRFRKVILPSYCCESMIEPFIRNDVEIQFYTVTQDGMNYPQNDAEVVLLIDFFGYGNSKNREIASIEQEFGKTVIYDATHKLNEWNFPADYVFCSYRKWLYCNFAIAWKTQRDFIVKYPKAINRNYIDLRNLAAMRKARYMSGEKVDKSEFLDLFAKAEDMLEKDYVGYAGMMTMVDIGKLVKQRRENANYLMECLKEIDKLRLWRSEMSNGDVPLFVPIFIKKDYRDRLRDYLIAHQIYCPVHWPISEYHRKVTNYEKTIYDEELSLICDQRYSREDMEREAKTIRNFFEKI